MGAFARLQGFGKAAGKGKGKASTPYGGGAQAKGGASQREEVPDERKAYVANLSFKTRFGFLKDHIKEHAGVEVKFVKIMTDASKGVGKQGRPFSKGRGIIEFATEDDCATAIAACNGTELDGRVIELDAWVTGWKKEDA